MPTIVISYRREDTELIIGRICDRLRDHYGPDQVIMDVDSIPFGLDFRKHIREVLNRCDTMLAVVGPSWAGTDEVGQSRLAEETDWVRIEIEAALAKDIPVIPVLINGARMPKPQELPETMQDFAFRQSTEIDMRRDFHTHMDRLIRVMDQLLAKANTSAAVVNAKSVKAGSGDSEESSLEKLGETQADAADAIAKKDEATSDAESDAKTEPLLTSKKDQVQSSNELKAIARLSPEQIAKAEELVNWAFITERADPQEFRDHLARFPHGVCSRMALQKLESFTWRELQEAPTVAALRTFLEEFLEGVHSNDARIRLDDLLKTSTPKDSTFLGHDGPVNAVAFAPDGQTVLSGSDDTTLRLWDVATGDPIHIFEGNGGRINSVAFAPDGQTVLSGSASRTLRDTTLKLWNVATGDLIRTFEGRGGSVYSVAFAPDGCTAIAGNWSGSLTLWDLETGDLIRTFEDVGARAYSVAFAPDGQTVLSGSDDTTLKLWDVATGDLIQTFNGQGGSVYSVAFAPDGCTAIAGNWNNSLMLWDLVTGDLIRTFEDVGARVYSVAFAPDGQTVLSGSDDTTLKLWNVATGELRRAFQGHDGPVNSVAFSFDGQTVLSGSDDTSLKLWSD